MVMAAQGNKVELWDKEAYQTYMKQNVGSPEHVGGRSWWN
jgi:DNA-binding transcriptional regulator/RsmH inhibitor MraZ